MSMQTEEALAELGIEWPWTNKLSCPKHSDSDPSLHLYGGDKGWYCFSCGAGGDGWALLSHFYDKPVADLMRERGVKLGPRPRSRWEQLDELERRANDARWGYQLAVRDTWGPNKRRHFAAVQETEDRITWLYGLDISAKHFPEDKPPYLMEQTVHDLELFLEDELANQVRLYEMSQGL